MVLHDSCCCRCSLGTICHVKRNSLIHHHRRRRCHHHQFAKLSEVVQNLDVLGPAILNTELFTEYYDNNSHDTHSPQPRHTLTTDTTHTHHSIQSASQTVTYLSSTQSALHKLPQVVVTVIVTDLLLEVVQEYQHFLHTAEH